MKKLLLIQNTVRLTCVWVPTGDLRNPLACVWVRTPAAKAGSCVRIPDESGRVHQCA